LPPSTVQYRLSSGSRLGSASPFFIRMVCRATHYGKRELIYQSTLDAASIRIRLHPAR